MVDKKSRATICFTVCNFLVKAISFITIPLFTRMLAPDEYGRMSVYYSYEQLFLIVATMELSLGAYQRGILRYKNNLELFTSSLLTLSLGVTTVVSIVVMLIVQSITEFMQVSVNTVLLMLVYFFVQPSYTAWQNRQRFFYNYKPVVFCTMLFAIMTTIGPILGIILFGPNADVKIGTMLVVEILFCAPFLLKQINPSLMASNRKQVLEMWIFSLSFQWPLVLHSFSYLILGQSDRVMIQKLVGDAETGIYSVAYTFANAMIIFQTSINQVYKPWRYQALEGEHYSDLARKTNFHILLFLVITVLFLLLIPDVFRLFMTEYYYQCIWLIPPISVGIFFMFLYTIFTDVEAYFGDTKSIMVVSVICAILNILGNYFGILYSSYKSCAYVTMICYILFAILHYLFMKRVLNVERINNNLFDQKTILIMSLAIVGFIPVSLFLYTNIFIRYTVIALLLILLLTNRKRITIFLHK